MTHRPSDKPSIVTVPFRQTVSKAGEIGSVTEDTSTWLPLENGLNIKDGKLALSTSSSTVVTNAQTLYPQLWANTPSAWKDLPSAGDLTIPAQRQVISEIASGSLSISDPDYTLNSGTWKAVRSGDIVTLDVVFDFDWNNPTDTTPVFNLVSRPSWLNFGQGNSDNNKGIVIPITDVGVSASNTTIFLRNTVDIAIYRNVSLGGFSGTGTFRSGSGSTLGKTVTLSFTSQDFGSFDNAPYIQLFDDVASNAIGLPDATAESKGLTTLNQVAEAGRNYVINGGFDFWQRGTSHSTEGYGSADRFRLGLSGGTCTVSRQAFTSNQTDVPGFPKYFLRFDATSGNDNLRLDTRLEDLRNFAGKTWTLSFWAKGTNPGGGSLYTSIDSRYGAAGTNFVFAVNEYQVSAIWQKFTFTFTVPDLDGTALDDTGCLIVNVINQYTDASTAAYQVDIAQVKLEEGTVATKFTRAGGTYAGELYLCRRRYRLLSQQYTSFIGEYFARASGTTNLRFAIDLGEPMAPGLISCGFPPGGTKFANLYKISDGSASTIPASGYNFLAYVDPARDNYSSKVAIIINNAGFSLDSTQYYNVVTPLALETEL